MAFNEDRQILNLTDSELEDLIKKWLAKLADTYVGFERPTASADMGRDAVGFRSPHRYDGGWDNYQCKHLKEPLGKAAFASELGKIFYHAGQGEFTLPSSYIFVCPNSAVRDVKKMIDRPSLTADFLVENWDGYCLNGISTTPIPPTAALEATIRAYPFEKVELWKASELVEKPQMRAVLHEHLDIDPGEAPRVTAADVPAEVAEEESAYVTQLVEAVQAAMHHYREAMRIVDDLTLCLVRNRTNVSFITSDDPAVLTNWLHLERRPKALRSFGPKSAGAIFLLPLTSNLCTIMFDSAVYTCDHQNSWIDLDRPRDIAALNAHQILRCHKNIYFRDWAARDELLTAVATVKPRRPAERQTVTQLVLEETTDWGEKYVVKPITDIRDGKKAMVHVQTNHPEPESWPSFLRFRSDPTAYSNNTGAGLTRLWCLEGGFVRGNGYREIVV